MAQFAEEYEFLIPESEVDYEDSMSPDELMHAFRLLGVKGLAGEVPSILPPEYDESGRPHFRSEGVHSIVWRYAAGTFYDEI